MQRIKLNKALLSALLTLLCLLPVYHRIIFNPNSYLFTDSGDGVKAYYVYAYHVKHDASYHQLEGMNYPYGQTYIYTDGQPAVANTVKAICSVLPFLEQYSIGIYNLLLILSLPLCAFFLYKILSRLPIHWALAVFGSVTITLLSPQIFRLGGHPTLAYACFFPITWYLLIRYFEKSAGYKFSTLLILNGIFWGLIHPYFAFIQTFFLSLVYVFYFIFYNEEKGFKGKLLKPIVQILLPLIILKVYTIIIDTHYSRPPNPTGILDYTATWQTVFLPVFEDWYNNLKLYTGNLSQYNWEGMGYAGIIANIALVVLLIFVAKKLVKGQFKNAFTNQMPMILKYAFWPAAVLLLFAMGIPFILSYKLSRIPEYITIIKQFRALGRFVWPFYFVAGVYSIWFIHSIYTKLKERNWHILAYAFVSVACIVISTEVVLRQQTHYNSRRWTFNIFNKEQFDEYYPYLLKDTEGYKYQAVIPLPFFHIGSENYGLEATSETMLLAFGYSYHTGKPILASSAARSPVNEAKSIMQFFAPDYYPKEIANVIKSPLPFLVLANVQELKDSTQKRVWNRAIDRKPIYFKGWEVECGLYYPNFDFKKAQAIEFTDYKNSVSNDNPLYFNEFETTSAEHIFEGGGAYAGEKKQFNTLAKDLDLKLDTTRYYTVSFWYYNNDDLINNNMFVVQETDSTGNNSQWSYTYDLAQAYNITGNYTLYEFTFRPTKQHGKLTLFTKSFTESRQYIFIDNLMVREYGKTVYRKAYRNYKPGASEAPGDTFLFKNNYQIGIVTQQ